MEQNNATAAAFPTLCKSAAPVVGSAAMNAQRRAATGSTTAARPPEASPALPTRSARGTAGARQP
jgi:hypothetical protein